MSKSDWEINIYSKSKQINKYIYSDVISYFYNFGNFSDNVINKSYKILEIGCGCGNNLVFFGDIGADVYGIEASPTACGIANKILKLKGINATICNSSFEVIPFVDSKFDFILDRAALYANTNSVIHKTVEEVYRVLKPGGVFLSFVFADDHPDIFNCDSDFIEVNTYTNFKTGGFAETGTVHFFNKEEILNLYKKFKIIKIDKINKRDLINNVNLSSELIIVLKK